MTQASNLGNGDPAVLNFALKQLSSPLPTSGRVPEAVVFVDAETPFESLVVRYAVNGDRVRFHVFAKEGLPWPPVEYMFRTGFASVAQFIHALEYVEEMESYYVELRGLPVQLTPALVESLLAKVAAA